MTKWTRAFLQLSIIKLTLNTSSANHLYAAYKKSLKTTATSAITSTEPTTALQKILSQWSEWETMRECPECGFGQQTRIRYCIHKMYDPQNHQRYYCEHSADGEVQYNDCYGPPCTPEWQEWSRWSQCSTTCGLIAGFKTRTRRCFDGASYIKSRLCERHDETSNSTDTQKEVCDTERT